MWRRSWSPSRVPTSRARNTIGPTATRRPAPPIPRRPRRAKRRVAGHRNGVVSSSSITEVCEMLDLNLSTHRRGFLGSVAATAAAFGLGSVVPRRLLAEAPAGSSLDDPQLDAWLKKIKGKHKQVYDMPEFNGGVGFVWSRVFFMTNAETGTPESDTTVVVILRHGGLPFAMNDAMWAKYKFGEVFKVNDPATNAPSVHNFLDRKSTRLNSSHHRISY